ncbi:Uncharacterised protein [Mycobacteroides abscessus]|nr:Uncharacterised protein [Mycobacteroides abscessus]CQA12119.1 Uncharacterised protein [Mycobacteroides abscessus]
MVVTACVWAIRDVAGRGSSVISAARLRSASRSALRSPATSLASCGEKAMVCAPDSAKIRSAITMSHS